jgi:hypothetical protein
VGTLAVRVTPKDKAEGTCAITVDIGPGGPTTLGRVFRLPEGRDLVAAVGLREPAATSPFTHAIVLGNVAGTMLSVYVMPGRSGMTRSGLPGTTPPPGDPAPQAIAAFRTWADAVKRGDLEQFAVIVPGAEWGALSAEQKAERLKEYQDSFKTVLGDGYAPEQFKVEYAGGAIFGRLRISYGDKTLPDLTARFVGGKWILTEP